jgi:hypothetical protein
MKKLIGVVVFVALGLFAFTREAPAAQTDGDDGVAAVREPLDHGCPPSRPHCCEPNGNSCFVCIPPGTSCP